MSKIRLFGLTIASDLELPGLLPAGSEDPIDVTIRRGQIDGPPDLSFDDAGAFAVRGGAEIIVEAPDATPERNIRLYLLGSAMGLLLHQRGLLPLHANAVEVDGRAIAVAGASGAGKSTLAAWFFDRGHRLIGDDVCVVRAVEGEVRAYPGVPRLRLWGATIEATGRDRRGLERAYAGDDEWDKWDVPVGPGAVVAEGLPLSAVYILGDGPDIAVTELTGASAAEALFTHTYRGAYVAVAGYPEAHWRTVLAVIGKVGVYRLQRPFDLTRQDALGERLLAHVLRR